MTGVRHIAALWLLTRLLLVWWYLGPESYAHGDLKHYATAFGALPEQGLASTLVEYPLPALALLCIPWTLSEVLVAGLSFPHAMLLVGVAADAAFLLALRHHAPLASTPQLLWIIGVPMLGSLAYGRFDLVPGVLVGLALLALAGAPRWASVAVAAAAGLKLWPVVVLPALAAPRSTRSRVVASAAVFGGGLTLATWALAGWDRLVSPLTWQSDRGLQIESVAATSHMLRWSAGSRGYDVESSRYFSWEISGPGVSGTVTATSLLTVVLALFLMSLWFRAWRVGQFLPLNVVVWVALTGVSGLMVTSRVLSPQYLMWLLPLAAAGTAVTEGPENRRVVRWALASLGVAALSHLVFPTGYTALTQRVPGSMSVAVLLATRNLFLVLLFVWAAREASLAVRRAVALNPHAATKAYDRVSPEGGPTESRAR